MCLKAVPVQTVKNWSLKDTKIIKSSKVSILLIQVASVVRCKYLQFMYLRTLEYLINVGVHLLNF